MTDKNIKILIALTVVLIALTSYLIFDNNQAPEIVYRDLPDAAVSVTPGTDLIPQEIIETKIEEPEVTQADQISTAPMNVSNNLATASADLDNSEGADAQQLMESQNTGITPELSKSQAPIEYYQSELDEASHNEIVNVQLKDHPLMAPGVVVEPPAEDVKFFAAIERGEDYSYEGSSKESSELSLPVDVPDPEE